MESSSSSSYESSDSSSSGPTVKRFSLSLPPVNKTSGPSYHEVASNFDTVNIILVCPDGKITFTLIHTDSPGEEIHWSYTLGEALTTFKRRLVNERQIRDDCKFYLGEEKKENYMMDPMSLNDFPAILNLAKHKNPVRIIVSGGYQK